ncbi:MAG: type 4a pilus biogenesis protein PilO [Planctomycetota bacterium]
MRSRCSDYVFVGVLAVAGVLFLQFLYRPAVAEVEGKGRRLRTTQAEILKSEDFTRGLDDLERYLEEFQVAISDLDRLVPRRLDTDDRLREISSVISGCGLLADSIRPDPPLPKGSLTIHPLTVKVVGDYAQIVRFLFQAESLPRHTRVTQLAVEHSLGRPGVLGAEIELTSYSVGSVDEGGDGEGS